MNDIFNEVKYSRLKRDITNFAEVLNNTLEILKEEGCLLSEVTEAQIKDLCEFDGKELEGQLERDYQEGIKEIPKALRRSYADDLTGKKAMLRERINQFKTRVYDLRASLGFYLEPYERRQFVALDNGRAKADDTAIRGVCTIRLAENVGVANFEERARKVWKEICALDAITRSVSHGALGFIGASGVYSQHLIECYDGKINLSLERLALLADATEEDFKKPAEFDGDKYFITGE